MISRRPVVLVPAKVAAAQDYLRFLEVVRCGGPAAVHGDGFPVPRELTPLERVTEHAATEVLRLYFTGEMEYGPPQPDDDDDKPPPRQLQEGE